MNLSKKFIRNLVLEGIAQELNANEIKHFKNPFITKVGHIDFKHNNKSDSIDLYIGEAEEPDLYMSYASLCKFTDNKVAILISKKEDSLFLNGDLAPALYGAIAHEIGHYINGDLDQENEDKLFLMKAIDSNTNKQIIFHKLDDRKYLRTTVFGVLKGGVLKNEMAADIVAVELVGLAALLMAHAYDTHEVSNLITLIEKRNRANRLMKMTKENKLELKLNSKIKIVFDKVRK